MSLLQRDQQYDEAIKVLEEWQTDHPNDSEAKKKIEEIRSIQSDVDTTLN